jgi:hypothetical protein
MRPASNANPEPETSAIFSRTALAPAPSVTRLPSCCATVAPSAMLETEKSPVGAPVASRPSKVPSPW